MLVHYLQLYLINPDGKVKRVTPGEMREEQIQSLYGVN